MASTTAPIQNTIPLDITSTVGPQAPEKDSREKRSAPDAESTESGYNEKSMSSVASAGEPRPITSLPKRSLHEALTDNTSRLREVIKETQKTIGGKFSQKSLDHDGSDKVVRDTVLELEKAIGKEKEPQRGSELSSLRDKLVKTYKTQCELRERMLVETDGSFVRENDSGVSQGTSSTAATTEDPNGQTATTNDSAVSTVREDPNSSTTREVSDSGENSSSGVLIDSAGDSNASGVLIGKSTGSSTTLSPTRVSQVDSTTTPEEEALRVIRDAGEQIGLHVDEKIDDGAQAKYLQETGKIVREIKGEVEKVQKEQRILSEQAGKEADPKVIEELKQKSDGLKTREMELLQRLKLIQEQFIRLNTAVENHMKYRVALDLNRNFLSLDPHVKAQSQNGTSSMVHKAKKKSGNGTATDKPEKTEGSPSSFEKPILGSQSVGNNSGSSDQGVGGNFLSINSASETSSSSSEVSGDEGVLSTASSATLGINAIDYTGTNNAILATNATAQDQTKKMTSLLQKYLKAAKSGNWDAVLTSLLLISGIGRKIMIKQGFNLATILQNLNVKSEKIMNDLTNTSQPSQSQMLSSSQALQGINQDRSMVTSSFRDLQAQDEELKEIAKSIQSKDIQLRSSMARFN